MKSAIAVFLPLTRLCRLRDIIQGMTPGLLRQSIFFLAVGMGIAGPQISDFDGAWVLKFNANRYSSSHSQRCEDDYQAR